MESYERIGWLDHVVDIITEEVIQEGTPVSQTNMNHMDDGIWQNRETIILHDSQIADAQREIKVLKDVSELDRCRFARDGATALYGQAGLAGELQAIPGDEGQFVPGTPLAAFAYLGEPTEEIPEDAARFFTGPPLWRTTSPSSRSGWSGWTRRTQKRPCSSSCLA